jgi:hypothetical protein
MMKATLLQRAIYRNGSIAFIQNVMKVNTDATYPIVANQFMACSRLDEEMFSRRAWRVATCFAQNGYAALQYKLSGE